VQENQTVIDTGLYGVVRHPMYSATLLLFLSMPLILGSLYAFVIFLAYPFLIAKRIKEEELFLEKGILLQCKLPQVEVFKLIQLR
jgi:protein-S-isoprenylcysteine O-methyltransferase Ste14